MISISAEKEDWQKLSYQLMVEPALELRSVAASNLLETDSLRTQKHLLLGMRENTGD
jgi:hypothetical protein